MTTKTYAYREVDRGQKNRAIANNIPKSNLTKKSYAHENQTMQRFVVQVGYDAGLAASPNKSVANSQKTVKDTAEKLATIDADKVNSKKIVDYPSLSLDMREKTSVEKTPIHLIAHGKPGGKMAGVGSLLDASTVATDILKEIKSKNQELEFIKLYSCFSMNEENTDQSSVAKFKSVLSSEKILGVPVYGAKGLLIPLDTNKAGTDLNVNVIPRRYSSASFGKKATVDYFKDKLSKVMDSKTDGTWEAPIGDSVSVINNIMAKVNSISVKPILFFMDNAPQILPAQQLLSSDPAAGTIDYDSIPSGEPLQSDKMEAAAIGAKLALNTLKKDIAGQKTLASIDSKIDSKIGEVDNANASLNQKIENTKFKSDDLKNILK